jgi:hypothetical protein
MSRIKDFFGFMNNNKSKSNNPYKAGDGNWKSVKFGDITLWTAPGFKSTKYIDNNIDNYMEKISILSKKWFLVEQGVHLKDN